MAERLLQSLDEDAVDHALSRAERGVRKYCWIQSRVREVDVRTDREFQRVYNGFYRVRRGVEWQTEYYALMEQSKGTGITFASALRALIERTGNIEASFASKLVATHDPSQPVIDRFVLSCSGIRLPSYGSRSRLKGALAVHAQLSAWYEDLVNTTEGLMIRERFSERYPWAKITELKKVDFVLWQHRPAATVTTEPPSDI